MSETPVFVGLGNCSDAIHGVSHGFSIYVEIVRVETVVGQTCERVC